MMVTEVLLDQDSQPKKCVNLQQKETGRIFKKIFSSFTANAVSLQDVTNFYYSMGIS